MAKPLSPQEILFQKEHIDDDKRPDIISSHVICLTLACIAVSLRYVARRIGRIRLAADDWLSLAGLIFTGALIGTNLYGVHGQSCQSNNSRSRVA